MDKKIRIWQLPEKSDDIDKSNDLSMIHDGTTLKKLKMEKLYDYFNQDYKVEDIVDYFKDEMQFIDENYQKQYELMDKSLHDYEEVVKELQANFKTNEDNIRELEELVWDNEFDLKNLATIFPQINDMSDTLSSIFKSFDGLVSIADRNIKVESSDVKSLKSDVSTLENDTSQLYSNCDSMRDQLKNIEETEDKDLSIKKETLKRNINDEYDKILSIVDHYHHIHTDDISNET